MATGLDRGPAARPSAWRRRNQAELSIRATISADARLSVFASGFAPGDTSPEVVVMITAAEDAAKDAARDLLGTSFAADWDNGWRPLALGDHLLRVYPDRSGTP
jgi:hypothetical protein